MPSSSPFIPILMLASLGFGQAQQPTPSAGGEETILVTAQRLPLELSDTPQTVSVIERKQIESLPVTQVAELLAMLPGLHVYDFGAAGVQPVADLRGFYSAGETSYLLLQVDGVAVNDLDTDVVDWTQVPLDQIERIEFVRGPVSTAYGNIGMTGLVNIVTRREPERRSAQARLQLGNQGTRRAAAAFRWRAPSDFTISASADHHQIAGYREHSESRSTQGRVALEWPALGAANRPWTLTGQLQRYQSDRDDPGFLRAGLESRSSDPQFRFDGDDTRRTVAAIRARWAIDPSQELDLVLGLAEKQQDAVKTLLFQSLSQALDGTTGSFGIGYKSRRSIGSGREIQWRVDLEGSRARLHSDWFGIDSGGERAAPLTETTSTRSNGAASGAVVIPLSESLSAVAGLRYDRIDGDSSQRGADPVRSRNSATSPSLSLNWSWAQRGHLYLSWSRAFKAPTLEQQFDHRPIFLSVDPPIVVSISNPGLKPLEGRQWELGGVVAAARTLTLTAATYSMTVENELGFDFNRFALANIAASRHRGFELGVEWNPTPRLSGQLSWGYSRATFRGGENDGNQINGVPRQLIATTWTARIGEHFSLGAQLQAVRDQFLDEANRIPLDNYSLVHLKGSWSQGPWRIEGSVRNLFDKSYYSAGFLTPDESLVPTPAYYPGQPRAATVSVSYSW